MTAAIKVENLSKKYIISHEKKSAHYETFSETLIQGSKNIAKKIIHPFSGKKIDPQTQEEFWALKDINFEINQGDKVGIIGRNGAGKSTLLKVLSRITEPTSGKIHINGRIASLLEVGTGFHPELTGRENIYLNGAILGMSHKEIKAKFDEIVAFAEVDKFLDTPVKRYSSGMYVRLAFSVAAHLEPEILVVDEVLAVGDVEFQKKCLGKMQSVSKEGRTIIFVSHNMPAITSLCSKGIVLINGKIQYQGNVNSAMNIYMKPYSDLYLSTKKFKGPLKKDIIFKKIKINNKEGNGISISPNEDILFDISGASKKRFEGFRMTLSIHQNDIIVLTTRDTLSPTELKEGEFEFYIKIPAYFLRPGHYSIALGGKKNYHSDWIHGINICDFFIKEDWDMINEKDNIGIINLPFNGNRVSGRRKNVYK